MPLYEYECTACHKRTEKIQKFSDPEITACPFCGAQLKRVISAPAFSLKGGGWYADGYGSAKPPATAAAEGSPGASDGAAKSGGTEAAATPAASTPAPAAAAAAPAAAAPASKS